MSGAPTGSAPRLARDKTSSGDYSNPVGGSGSFGASSSGNFGEHTPHAPQHSRRARTKVQQTRLLDSKYQLGEELGRGSSGKVYRALNRETGDFRAIKEISTQNMAVGHLQAVQSEIDLLHNLQHPQIVRYFETIRTEHHLYLVLEYVENGSLSALVKNFGSFPEQLTCVYVRQVLAGLQWLHEREPTAWPDTRDTALFANADTVMAWLGPELEGVTSQSQLQRADLGQALRRSLNWEQYQELETRAPERFRLTSGIELPIDYRRGSSEGQRGSAVAPCSGVGWVCVALLRHAAATSQER